MSAEHIFDTAVMLMRAGRRDEAAAAAWEVLRKNQKHADAWALRARIEAEAGRFHNAMLHHGFAVGAAPSRHDLWCNRGIDAMNAKMHKESEESFKRSLELQDTYEGHYNYGNLLCSIMRVDDAIEQFRDAIRMDPEINPQVNVNLGQCLMATGHWREGYQGYRHRFNSPGFPPAPRMNYPLWRGEPLDGKTILLFSEQGFGDEIMSLRFAKSVKDLGARVIVAVRPPMFRLARSLQCADAVILQYDEPPFRPDFMCALLDIPAFLDIEPKTLPLKGRYLSADDRGFSLEFPAGLNVGVCWASGKRDLQPAVAETARQKSLSFRELAAPLMREGVNLVSLQQHHGEALREFGVFDPMEGVTDFADTAWIISQLDLVVTVDTAVAHLAGALGKPVLNLVRFDGLWPWMKETRETCWYDSMTIYRQTRPFDWSEPLKNLQCDFAKLVGERKAAA